MCIGTAGALLNPTGALNDFIGALFNLTGALFDNHDHVPLLSPSLHPFVQFSFEYLLCSSVVFISAIASDVMAGVEMFS